MIRICASQMKRLTTFTQNSMMARLPPAKKRARVLETITENADRVEENLDSATALSMWAEPVNGAGDCYNNNGAGLGGLPFFHDASENWKMPAVCQLPIPARGGPASIHAPLTPPSHPAPSTHAPRHKPVNRTCETAI